MSADSSDAGNAESDEAEADDFRPPEDHQASSEWASAENLQADPEWPSAEDFQNSAQHQNASKSWIFNR